MPDDTCSVDECPKLAARKGWCHMHYMRAWRHGSPSTVKRVTVRGTPVERFWAKVDKDTPGGCWEWMASVFVDRYGYGKFNEGTSHDDNRTVYAHRFAYELESGPIPDGMHVLHQCDNPPCVNPAHLRLGTHADNMREMVERNRDQWSRGTRTKTVGCSEPGCNRKHQARGWCKMHYERWRRSRSERGAA
jgi:hypothetical protein